MWHCRYALQILILCYALLCTCGLDIVTVESRVGRFVALPDDAQVWWTQMCSRDLEAIWISHAQDSIPDLKFYVDLSPGYGNAVIPMARYAVQTVALLVENSSRNLVLHHNLEAHPDSHVSLSFMPGLWEMDFFRPMILKRYGEFFTQMNSCPSLVHVRYLSAVDLPELWVLVQNYMFLMSECRTTIFVDTNSTHLLLAASDLLSSLQYKGLRLQELCSFCGEDTLTSNSRMVLYGHFSVDSKDESQQRDYYGNKFAAFQRSYQHLLNQNSPTKCNEVRQRHTQLVQEPFEIKVSWQVLMPVTAVAYSVTQLWNQLNISQPSVFASSTIDTQEDLEDLTLSYMSGHRLDQEEVRVLLQLRCLAWSERHYQRWLVILHDLHLLAYDEVLASHPTNHMHLDGNVHQVLLALYDSIAEATYNLASYARFAAAASTSLDARVVLQDVVSTMQRIFEDEKAALGRNCGALSFSQYEILDGLRHAKYPNSATSEEAKHFPSTSDGRDLQNGTYPEENLNVDYRFYASTADSVSPGSSKSRRDRNTEGATNPPWFTRAPFETRLPTADDDSYSCGEPLWCSHAQAFQHRVQEWQLIPTTSTSSSFSEPSASTTSTTSTASTNSSSADLRTCSTARLLVYNPFAVNQGIGAILEQIALVMRYAACHDRLLVLTDTDSTQSGRLLKWRMPGCAGSILDCYFEPLSSSSSFIASIQQCRPSAAEMATAFRSSDGQGFDEYPWQDHRVLVLEGLPMVGPCTMCSTEPWPTTTSSFFDGLLPTTGNLTLPDYPYMAAFLNPMRHLSTAMFLRHALRPRPWFSHLLRQVVSYAMVSPTDERDDAEKKYAQNAKYIAATDFPRHFVSLHIRYGMKRDEVQLQPLSRYMRMVRDKYPLHRDIFVSTETEDAILELTR